MRECFNVSWPQFSSLAPLFWRPMGLGYFFPTRPRSLRPTATRPRRVDVDLWAYRTDDGRSIRKALDYLLPYATGDEKWTHQQLDGMNAAGLYVPLLRASRAYHVVKYAKVAAQLKIDPASRDVLLHGQP
jgi:hypothetical protein